MITLIVVVILAIALAYAAWAYLPDPISWIAALCIILFAAVYLFSGLDLSTETR